MRAPAAGEPVVGLRPAGGRTEWAAGLAAAGPSTPFHEWGWLDWVAPLIGCRFLPLVVVSSSDTPVGVAPMLLKRRGPFQTANWVPFPYVGPLVPPGHLGPTLSAVRRWARRERIADLQLTAHPLTATSRECGDAFAVHGFDPQPDATYIVALGGRDLDEIHGAMERMARTHLRKAQEAGVTTRPSSDREVAELLPRIHADALGRQGLQSPYSPSLGDVLAARPPAVPLRITSAVLDGTTIGVLATLGGPITVGWMGGVMRQHQKTNAAVALYWDAISWAHGIGSNHIDLVGVPTPGIAKFKKQFGGHLYAYLTGHRSLPLYTRLRSLHSWSTAITARAGAESGAGGGPQAPVPEPGGRADAAPLDDGAGV